MEQAGKKVHLVECPRDAMQGLKQLVPTELKIRYLNLLLECGFHTIDSGSFVSAAAVPQLADTAEVLHGLNHDRASDSNLLVIVGNARGAKEAVRFQQVKYLGFPLSVSEQFQIRNTNTGRQEAFERLKEIQLIAQDTGKECVVYLSMGFGNPYGDPYSVQEVKDWATTLVHAGFGIISLSDTIGSAKEEDIDALFGALIPAFPAVEFGAHLHSVPGIWHGKVQTALDAGCRRFDGALRGFGGCPFAMDQLTGNLPTETLIEFLEQHGWETGIDRKALSRALAFAPQIFI
ncbi:MAG: hydroxymethylglutaryl-CoA lyase [Bacteroidetes bacterium]|nr:hydroxymethylglutaryl-CoA lyase [Bacteroidota bacterium]